MTMWRCFTGEGRQQHAGAGGDVPTANHDRWSACTPHDQPKPGFPCGFMDVSAQLQELFSSATSTSGGQATDTWGALQRAADVISATASSHISINILPASRRHVKVVCSEGMPMPHAVQQQWELSPITSFPSVLEVAQAGKQVFTKAPGQDGGQWLSTGGGTAGFPLCSDYVLLQDQGQCTCFTHIPLMAGGSLQGTLLIASGPEPHTASAHSLVSALWPMISMFLVESNAVQLCTMLEKLQTTTSIHSLAWTIVTEFNTWLEWGHSDDTEARLVLINEEKPQALVLHRSTAAYGSAEQQPTPTLATPSTSTRERSGSCATYPALRRGDVTEDSGIAAAAPRSLSGRERPALRVVNTVGSGKSRARLSTEASMDSGEYCKQVLQDGLQGTQMSLLNTLTRRCMMDGSKLLFVADVMSALRTYGEPWNDIFLDQAVVSNPTWAIAAPLKIKDRCVAAVIWLSHTRLNAAMLAQATRLTLVPLLHALSQQLQQLVDKPRARPMSPSGTLSTPSFSSVCMSEDLPSLFHQFVGAGSGLGSIKRINSNNAMLSSHHSMSRNPSAVDTPTQLEDEACALSTLLSPAATGSTEPPTPLVRYTVSRTDCASTQALVRAYQTAIAQHQRTSQGANPEAFGQVEEIEIIAKVGQGAFGSVFVAMWKGQMVAAKVMKQAEGRKAMRMAWEMAVSQTLQHPHIITVHAVLMDVVVEKRGARTLRFNPFVPIQEVPIGSEPQLQQDSDKTGPRCQVIIMEYCSLGPLHNYVMEKRFLRKGALGQHHQPPDKSEMHSDDALSRVQRSRSCFGDQINGMHNAPDLMLILSVLIDVASAMVYLHRSGFIHLDLKPDNILLKVAQSESGFVAKVSDFGLSDLFTSDGPLIGEMGGTLTHLAPEIITQRKATRACDVYSFGICMYELYTCQRPYADVLHGVDRKTRDKELLTRVTEGGLRPQFPRGANAAFVALAHRCWAADPSQRPTFQEVLSELRAMHGADPTTGSAARQSTAGAASSSGVSFGRHNSFTTAKRGGEGNSRTAPIHRVPYATLDTPPGSVLRRPSSSWLNTAGGSGAPSPVGNVPAPVLE